MRQFRLKLRHTHTVPCVPATINRMPRYVARLRVSGTIGWTCPKCGQVNQSRSFPQHTKSFDCVGENCAWRGRPVLRERVASHADADADLPDERDSFPAVPVERVQRHVDDRELAHSR